VAEAEVVDLERVEKERLPLPLPLPSPLSDFIGKRRKYDGS
jgi:hypothetical protein